MGWLPRLSTRPSKLERPPLGAPWELGMERMSWAAICRSEDYGGQWVALEQCRYDDDRRPLEGAVVDADPDLATLCSRIRGSEHRHCAILFAGEEASAHPATDAEDPFRGTAP